ncbi:MAG: o-succinylbenzoate synthase [Halanaeroarchaeum sp.]
MRATRRPFELPLATPFETAGGLVERRSGWIVQIGTDPAGLGEVSPLPGFTESDDRSDTALSTALSALESDDTSSALAAVRDRPAARNGLVTALLDRRAKRNDRPLHRELGGEETVESIPVQATIGDADPRTTADRAADARGEGFRTIKVKVGVGSIERDLDRLEAVRSSVGAGVAVRVDANGAWEFDTARRAIDGLERVGVSLVEQPLEPTDLGGHRRLRGSLPIALDESVRERSTDEILDAGAADALVLKPMALGGPDVARAVGVRARRAGIGTIVSNTIDAAIARTAAVHVAASLPERNVSGLATADMLASDVANDPAPVSGGRITVPNAAGLGITEVTVDA